MGTVLLSYLQGVCQSIKQRAEYIVTTGVSIALFYALYGFKVLNPLYIDWLLAGGDPTQHYLGWALYRYAPFRIRLGLLNTAAYPYDTSVIFTDSIPLMAVPCKFIGIFTDRQFQYFGIWGMACIILMSVCSCYLFKRFTDNKILLAMLSMLVTLSPCMLRRIFWHSSLGAHFLIIIGLILIVYRDRLCDSMYHEALRWAILAFLCAFVHIYFLAMTGFILVGYMVCVILDNRKTKTSETYTSIALKVLIPPVVFCMSAAISIWFLGGFSSGMLSGAPGLGYYSFNLNGFFDPDGWSSYFKPLGHYEDGQYEGFSYLGSGVVVLVFVAILSFAVAFGKRSNRKKMIQTLRDYAPIEASMLIIFTITILISASNEVTFGHKLLFRYEIPDFIDRVWGIFRASGRLIWPAVYIIAIISIIILYKVTDHRFLSVILMICVILQLGEMNQIIKEKHREFDTYTTYENRLDDDAMTRLMSQNRIKHIVFLDKDNLKQDELYAFTELATRYRLTVNDFYFARYLEYPVEETVYRNILYSGDDVLYVLSGRPDESDDPKDLANMFDLQYYQYGDVLIGFKNP